MLESINWPFEITTVFSYCNQFPTLYPSLSSLLMELICVKGHVLPFLHKAILRRAVYDFSKVEKKIVANQQNSCKGSQCNRVDPITNPLNSGVTL